MTSDTRAQRIVDEFNQGATHRDGFSVRHGLAAVLTHLADTEDDADCYELAIPVSTIRQIAMALTAPTLLDRAMAGDTQAARQFLYEAGFHDASGNWLPQYQSQESDD